MIKPTPSFSYALQRQVLAAMGLDFNSQTHSSYTSRVARRCCIDTRTMRRYLTGIAVPQPQQAQQISKALKWDYSDIVTHIIQHKHQRFLRLLTQRYAQEESGSLEL